MSAASERRFLRPRHVFYSDGHVWVVDESQPVAALFAPDTGTFVRLVSWAALPDAPSGSHQQPTIVGDSGGLWVQTHADGPLVRITADCIVRGEYAEDHRLTCAGPAGAWCVRAPRRRRNVAASPEVPPHPIVQRPTLLVAGPDGGTQRVVVDVTAIVSIEFDEHFLYLGVEHPPWERVPTPPGADRSGFEVRWHWGCEARQRDTTTVRAYRHGESTPAVTVELSQARVVDGAAAGNRLWMVVASENRTGTGRSVLVADLDGAVQPIPIDDVDITDHCRPVGPEPLDHRAYVDYCVRRLDGMRFSDEVDDVSASYVGQWPHGRIHLRFRHSHYPGLTLVARLNLYDEQGVRLERFFTYVPAMLMEQAGTHDYPPRSAAVKGVLYV